MTHSISKSPERAIRRYLIGGLAACALLVGGAGSLAAFTNISGAVIARGTLVVDSSVKKIQHLSGGMIDEINVRDGDKVKAGQLLLRLDTTVIEAEHNIVSTRLDEFRAQLARFDAERSGADAITFPPLLMSRSNEPAITNIMAKETSLFEARRSTRAGQKAQLQERIIQSEFEITGLTEQQGSKKREIELIGTELEGVRKLWKNKYVSLERITALERDAVRMQGEHGQIVAAIAQAKGRVAEINLQILQIDQQLQTEVAEQSRDVQARIAEYTERKATAEDQLKHTDIRSPQDGVVHQLAVHTVGGVVSPGQSIMLIVPTSDALSIEAHIMPQDIDQLRPGEAANMHLSAFNRQTTPEVKGKLINIAPDLIVDERSGVGYYKAKIELPATELAKLQGLELTPGMPVEVFFPTGERTMLSYLVKPISDQLERSFREE